MTQGGSCAELQRSAGIRAGQERRWEQSGGTGTGRSETSSGLCSEAVSFANSPIIPIGPQHAPV